MELSRLTQSTLRIPVVLVNTLSILIAAQTFASLAITQQSPIVDRPTLAVSPSSEFFGQDCPAWKLSGEKIDEWAKENKVLVKRFGKSVFLIDPETFQIGRIQKALDAASHLTDLNDLNRIDFSSMDPEIRDGILEMMGGPYTDSIGPIIAGSGIGRIVPSVGITVTDGTQTIRTTHFKLESHAFDPTQYSDRPNESQRKEHAKKYSISFNSKSAFGLNYAWAPSAKTSKEKAEEIQVLTALLEAEIERQKSEYDRVWPKFIKRVMGKNSVPEKGARLSDLPADQIASIRDHLMLEFGNDRAKVDAFLAASRVVNANPIASVGASYKDEKGFGFGSYTQLNVRRRFWRTDD